MLDREGRGARLGELGGVSEAGIFTETEIWSVNPYGGSAQLRVGIDFGVPVVPTAHERAEKLLREWLSPEQLALYRVVVRDAHRFPELGQRYLEQTAGVRDARFAGYLDLWSAREGWRAKTFGRGMQGHEPFFHVIEFWLENRLMIEVSPPDMTREYEDFIKGAATRMRSDPEALRLMRATHIKEPA